MLPLGYEPWLKPTIEKEEARRTLEKQVKMVEIPALKLNGQNWKIYCAKILEDAATLDVLDVLAGWRTEPDDEDTNDWEDWYSCDCSAKWLIYPILPPQLVTPIQELQTAHKIFVFLAHKFHDTDLIKRDAKKKVETCANDEVSKGQSGSASSHAAETYQTVKQAGIAAESPENLPMSGDGLVTNNGDKGTTHQVEMMQAWLRKFAGTCHRCGEVGHWVRHCRRSIDPPNCSTKGAATIMDGQAKTWGHNPCYNFKKKLPKSSRRESVAIERPTNMIEHVVDGLETNLSRKVSDDKEENLLNVPDGLRKPRDEPQKLQSSSIEGESWRCEQQAAEGTNGSAGVVGKTADVDGKALPGSKLAKRANEANAADETPDGRQPQPQQRQLYHKGSQCNENAKRNIPSTHGVPLEGEWSVCASSRVRDLKSDSHGRGVSEYASVEKWCWPVKVLRPIVWIPKGHCQLGRVDGNTSCKEMSVDGQGKSAKLVPMTVELDDPGGSKAPHVYLEGTKT